MVFLWALQMNRDLNHICHQYSFCPLASYRFKTHRLSSSSSNSCWKQTGVRLTQIKRPIHISGLQAGKQDHIHYPPQWLSSGVGALCSDYLLLSLEHLSWNMCLCSLVLLGFLGEGAAASAQDVPKSPYLPWPISSHKYVCNCVLWLKKKKKNFTYWAQTTCFKWRQLAPGNMAHSFIAWKKDFFKGLN